MELGKIRKKCTKLWMAMIINYKFENEQNCPTCLVFAEIFRWTGFNIQIWNDTWRLFFFSINSAFIIISFLCKKIVCTFFYWSCKTQPISISDIWSDSNILWNEEFSILIFSGCNVWISFFYSRKWYFVTKIVLTYCEKELFSKTTF